VRIAQRMAKAIREQRYRVSAHANEELSADRLTSEDVESIIVSGQVTARFTHDPRGIRYEITGHSGDGRRASVVCRFLPSNVLLIITAYLKSNEG
jgi:hypothetical protein